MLPADLAKAVLEGEAKIMAIIAVAVEAAWAAEREACAKVSDARMAFWKNRHDDTGDVEAWARFLEARAISDEIRARGDVHRNENDKEA